MKKAAIVVLVALMALGFAPMSRTFAQGKIVRVTLIDENGSGEDGSAQLTDQGDGTTKVELIMMNAPEGADQPAHIHKGTCTTLDPNPAYPLNDVKDGKSTTVIKVSLADLQEEKYAINVHKSMTEVAVYVSCGNLPLASTSSSTSMTIPQVLSTLLDQATELLGNIKNKETDASKNSYVIYHATFAAHEADIKAKSANTQAELDQAMTEVNDNLTKGDFEKAEAAAEELVTRIKEAQTTLASSGGTSSGTSSSSSAPTFMNDLKEAADDLLNETKNSDKDGAQTAYTKFHDLFAANEDAIKAKTPDGQAHIEAAMHEVNDNVNAGNFAEASTAAQELVNEVTDATNEMSAGGSNSDLPTSGAPSFPLAAALLLAAALSLVALGKAIRQKAN